LLIHLAEDGTGPVSEEALVMAIRWGEYLETHARRIFAPAVMSDIGAARALGAKILAGELGTGSAAREVYRHGWSRLSSSEAADAAAAVLLDHDWLVETTERTPGRSKTRYWINPRVFDTSALLAEAASGGPAKGDRSPFADPFGSSVSDAEGPFPAAAGMVVDAGEGGDNEEWGEA
jgi:hypothetical protein